MLFHEWNWEEAMEVVKEDGIAIGEAKGMEKILEYLKQGHTIAEAEMLLKRQ